MARLYLGNNLVSFLTIKKNLDLNIHVGNTAPDDTSKLWINCSEPSSYEVLDRTQGGGAGEWTKNITSDGTRRTEYENQSTSGNLGVYVGNKAYALNYSSSTSKLNIYELDLTSNTSEWTQVVTDRGYWSSSYSSNFAPFEYNGLLHFFESYSTGNYTDTNIRLCRMNADYTITQLANTTYYNQKIIRTLVIGDYAYCIMTGTNILKYDLTNYGSFTSVGTISGNHYYCGYAVHGTNIYRFGGYNSSALNTIIKIDTLNNTITTLDTTLPTAAKGIGTAVIDNEIYLIGGDTYTNSSIFTANLSAMYKFNTADNTLTEVTLESPLAMAGNIIRYNPTTYNIEFFGGYVTNASNYYRYSLPMIVNLESGKLQILTDASAIECEIIKSDNSSFKQGISKVKIGNSEGHAENVTAYVYNTSTSTWDLI